MRWCIVMRLLYTTTQLGLRVRSIRRLARVGIETLGSFVHWSKSESMMISLYLTCLASLGTYSQDVSSSVRWSPQWLPCTPPWPGPDLPDCVAPPGSCHWESVLLESASWPEIGDIWASSLIWNWTLIAWWWQGEGSTGSGAIFCVVCVNCVMGLCAAHGRACQSWSILANPLPSWLIK